MKKNLSPTIPKLTSQIFGTCEKTPLRVKMHGLQVMHIFSPPVYLGQSKGVEGREKTKE
jgi:hypothetical protein